MLWWTELWRHMVVVIVCMCVCVFMCVCVYVCVCVILSLIFLHSCCKLGAENYDTGISRYSLKSLDQIFYLEHCSVDTA